MSTRSEDYTRIATAISFIREHQRDQPDLSEIARHVGLSEYHFQKMFTRWAGISPKRFLQYITLEHAKSLIGQTRNILDLSYDVGLSGPGRLHDLFVNLEAVSPGEYKQRGAGLTIRYGVHPTRFGRVLVAITERGICNLHFVDHAGEQGAYTDLQSCWPKADIVQDTAGTESLASAIFDSDPSDRQKPLNLLVKGTNFQVQVWRALLRVPSGSLVSYQTVAEMVGRPAATRAVGNAVGQNPVSYLIPCHRVIRGSGEIGGYRWGSVRKSLLIGWERGQQEVPERLSP